ncbi:MAG: hypothetical protein MMC33_000820 [Icmadophila ericetorum]|nr:hypothetical protein [Icmadophila ericetorum]
MAPNHQIEVPAAISALDGVVGKNKLDQDYKREIDQRRKWAHGTNQDYRPCSQQPVAKVKPMPTASSAASKANKRYSRWTGGNSRKPSRLHPDFNSSDSSAAEEVIEASAAPEPDVDITYSFDAPRGPSHGSAILSMAINKAVDRFETKVTEKLVKDEYDVVEDEQEDANEGYVADEDDFELV